jgi:hypothetical protein
MKLFHSNKGSPVFFDEGAFSTDCKVSDVRGGLGGEAARGPWSDASHIRSYCVLRWPVCQGGSCQRAYGSAIIDWQYFISAPQKFATVGRGCSFPSPA